MANAPGHALACPDTPLFVLPANPTEPDHLADRVLQPHLFDAADNMQPTELPRAE